MSPWPGPPSKLKNISQVNIRSLKRSPENLEPNISTYHIKTPEINPVLRIRRASLDNDGWKGIDAFTQHTQHSQHTHCHNLKLQQVGCF